MDTSNFDKHVELLVKKLHLPKEKILSEAILIYEDYLKLKREFSDLDLLSDECLVNFEKSL
jgi:hypothetical protein